MLRENVVLTKDWISLDRLVKFSFTSVVAWWKTLGVVVCLFLPGTRGKFLGTAYFM